MNKVPATLKTLFVYFLVISVMPLAAQKKKGKEATDTNTNDNGEIYERLNYTWNEQPQQHTIEDKYKNVNAVVIRDFESVEVKFNKEKHVALLKTFNVLHRIVQINTDKGIEQYNKVKISLGKNEKLHSITARTISSNGHITLLDNNHIKELKNGDKSTEKVFAIEGLEKGGTLEYIIKTFEDYRPFYTCYMQSNIPVLYKQVELIVPEAIVYDYKVYNGEASTDDRMEQSTLDKQWKDFYYYTASNIPALPDEKYTFFKSHLRRLELQFAYNYKYYRPDVHERDDDQRHHFATYNDMANSLYNLYYNGIPQNLGPIKEAAANLYTSTVSDEEKIRKIENYIKSNFYIAEELETEKLDIPSIIKNKSAALQNLLQLYIAFFKSENIVCLLGYTCDKTFKTFDPDFHSYGYLRDPVLYFPKYKTYIDPANLTIAYPLCSSHYANNGVFMLNLKNREHEPGEDYYFLSDIILPDTIHHINNMTARINFTPGLDSVVMDIEKTETNYFAEDIRSSLAFAPAEKKNDEIYDDLHDNMKDASIENLQVSNGELANNDKPLVFRARLTGASLIESSGKDLLFRIGDVIGPQTALYDATNRTNPIDLNNTSEQSRKIELVIPSGYKVSGLEALQKDVEFKFNGRDTAGFKSSYKLNGNVLTIDVSEYYLQTSLPVKAYSDFRNVINASADFNKVKLILTR